MSDSTTQNIPEVEALVREMVTVTYEHGQWWILIEGLTESITISVVDCDAGGVRGLDVELC